MDGETGVITNPKFRMWLRPDGIVQLVRGPRTTVLVEDAHAALEAMARLTGGRPSPLLVDMHDTGPLNRAARAELTRRSELETAVALVVGTSLTRMMANSSQREQTAIPGAPLRQRGVREVARGVRRTHHREA